MSTLKLNKWLSLLVALIYFLYNYNNSIFEGAKLLEYLNLVVNFSVVLILCVWLISKSRVENVLDLVILSGFILYLFVLHSYVSLVNVSYYFTQEYVGDSYISMQQINLIPFKTIFNNLLGTVVAPVTIIQTAGNFLLLLPLSFALLALKIVASKYKVAQTILVISLLIETFQLFLNFSVSGYLYSEGGHRAIDIDDVILNTVGGLVGIIVFIIYKKVVSKNNVTTNTSTFN
ncbi:VanZ family protein [Bacillus sp. V2I10]|uniref:VanZ family protein n=1 Tax=Bacillus sp. V2I10 TaxID=3042276 RepID=UPI00277D590A|nr:VanZ family protein [Bacillus sp. V2I10]MDQ0859392.1 glycopeptide antibiotics resistance protein [Bacillus sp. V2I10]